jgi:hypothetical protein
MIAFNRIFGGRVNFFMAQVRAWLLSRPTGGRYTPSTCSEMILGEKEQ